MCQVEHQPLLGFAEGAFEQHVADKQVALEHGAAAKTFATQLIPLLPAGIPSEPLKILAAFVILFLGTGAGQWASRDVCG